MKTYNVKSGATIEERLAFYTYVDYDTGCHVWVGSKTEKGYGQIGDGYKAQDAQGGL